ncbi:MAG TPA: SUMF1/EgtB/PvdO family nonheme iron enzyme [Thermoanaerobaculia bacterium]|nr:SUMF1/EgtB/PvdO family nonheme iron enzyme [Thermoanaerobaculia bacterium]
MTPPIDRERFIRLYRANRERSRAMFDCVTDDAWYDRPIPLRNPIIFYEGHFPAFSFNTLVRQALGGPSIDRRLEDLFARGIDPAETPTDDFVWPDRRTVRDFVQAVDETVLDALANAPLQIDGNPLLERSEAVFTILEHELMHHETLSYLVHRLSYEKKQRPPGYRSPESGDGASREKRSIRIPAGRATLGSARAADSFGWDNEFDLHRVDVPAFEIDAFNVTNEDFAKFIAAGGYTRRELWSDRGWEWIRGNRIDAPPFWERVANRSYWRGMFERVPLPSAWPVWVTHAEASAYARWRGGRLPTEAEFHRAAFATANDGERPHPWGCESPNAVLGNFGLERTEPVAVGSRPAGASFWGVEDLVGNGWEWTSSVFGPFPGFTPMPSYPAYSADFFDGEHFVLKGASPSTPIELIRRSFRNWFRPAYPYVYASFRCVSG